MKAEHPEISMHDAMSIVLAHRRASCLLIMGELEREVAMACDIDARHLLWLVEQMEQAGTATYDALSLAVEALSVHPLVTSPDEVVRSMTNRLRKLSGGPS